MKKLSKEIMDGTRAMYKHNFENGVDTEQSRWWLVCLLGLAGLVGGGALGWGADYAGRYNSFPETEVLQRRKF